MSKDVIRGTNNDIQMTIKKLIRVSFIYLYIRFNSTRFLLLLSFLRVHLVCAVPGIQMQILEKAPLNKQCLSPFSKSDVSKVISKENFGILRSLSNSVLVLSCNTTSLQNSYDC